MGKDKYAPYREANPAIVNKFGGRYIALGGEVKVLEGDWHPRRTVIIEFPDMSALTEFYESEEYGNLRPITAPGLVGSCRRRRSGRRRAGG